MKIRVLQNASHEGPAHILTWAKSRGHTIDVTRMYHSSDVPRLDDFDWLIIMGGPMGVHDEIQCPWLVHEKSLIESAIAGDKIVMGVCLGAQLIAQVLGARVYKSSHAERGWSTLSLTREAESSRLFSCFPKEFTAFVWHDDVFDLPAGATHLVSNKACPYHAFEYGKVVGLQFHLEVTSDSIRAIMDHSFYKGISGSYVQDRKQIEQGMDGVDNIHSLMDIVLDGIDGK
jgi:GMP synthase (glutamine-hydrolysing)